MAEIWTEKYSPDSLEEFIGNSEIADEAVRWADAWNKGKKQVPLLLWGQTGAGKTCLAILIAKLNGWGLFELNASDFRTKEVIDKLAGAAAFNASFSGKKRLILLDEIDGLQAQDRGGASAILSIMRETQNPIILTANDIYSDKKLAPIRVMSKTLEFKKINYLSIAKRLREILDKEKIEYDEEAVKELAKSSGGDFRSVLLDLQTLSFGGRITAEAVNSLGRRERQEKIFKVLRQIFKGKEFSEIRKARFSSEISNDLLARWIEENIPRQYKGSDISSAFDYLSRADIFNGRIMRRQHYGFLRYSSELMTAGVALSRQQEYHDFVMYQFPQLLSKLSKSSSIRAVKSSLAKKIGKQTHSSSRAVISKDLAFIKMLARDKEKAVSLTAQFDFDEKELAFLIDTKPNTKKVNDILGRAEELKAKEIAKKRKIVSQLIVEDRNQKKLF